MVFTELLAVQPYPDRSLLEGGGKLALLFSGQLPPGPKWLSFISQQRAEYVHQVEALQENVQALSAIIPKHHIPETLMLQVVCGGQVVAQTEFTYYANAQYHSDLLFQYLTQSFPGYFPQIEPGPLGDIGSEGGVPGGGAGGYMYGGHNIPPTSYSLLLGACRLGIEPLVLATLQLTSMQAISAHQLQHAVDVCEEHSHENLVAVLKSIVALAEVVAKGDGRGGRGLLPEEAKEVLSKLDNGGDPKDGSARVLARLVQIRNMEERAKLEEERETGASPTSPAHSDPPPLPCRLSSRLQRQDESVHDDEEEDEEEEEGDSEGAGADVGRGRGPSVSEQEDEIAPLRPRLSVSARSKSGGGGGSRRMLAATYSDAADSAVSMSFDRDELARRASASLTGYSLNMGTEGAVNVNIEAEAGYTFSNALQYECAFLVTEDYPPGADNLVLKAGDRIVQIGDTAIAGKGPDDFHVLLQTEAPRGTTVKVIPRLSPPPSVTSVTSSAGYGSLEPADRRPLMRRQSDQQLMGSLTMKVSNLLSMRASGAKRSVTIPYVGGEGFGFKMIGGNAVGLFVSEVLRLPRKELQPGDQILEINGQSTRNMTHFEASQLMGKEKVSLLVTENTAKFQSIRDHFEHESYYVRCHVDHATSDPKDMRLEEGDVVRVVNTTLFPSAWLAWRVDESTGVDLELRRIPSPVKAKMQYGKDVYEKVATAESAQQRPLLVA